MIKIAPSILSADFSAMGAAVESLAGWNADYVHLDVMDGSFVPTITFGPAMCRALRRYSTLTFDVHLMVEHPETFVGQFRDAGADIITFHVEAEKHIHRVVQTIKNAGLKAGVVLNPATPIEYAQYVISECDMVLLMSVNPGAGGQKFIYPVLDKIERLRMLADELNPALEIEIDGGVNPQTAALCAKAGANVLVAGSSVFGAADPRAMIAAIRTAAEGAQKA